MKIEYKPAKITFDQAGFENEIFGIVRGVLDEFEKEYLEKMAEIIDHVDTKRYFKTVVKDYLKHIEEEVSNGVITYVAGFDAGGNVADTMKAYVIAYGMGSKGKTGIPIKAGPPGRIVWNNMLDAQVPSEQEEHLMPKSWNHAGIDFVHDATEEMRKHFNDMLEDIASKIPSNIIAKHIRSEV